jgi:outer membrane protein TolC
VRSALHRAGASGAAVRLREDAARAAQENLGLVTDGYRQGNVNTITLLDAQNQALLTELAAANAQYDFLIDLVDAQRAAGHFPFLAPPAVQDAFFRRLEQTVVAPPAAGGAMP